MKFAFYTLGCKVNQYETSVMQKMILDAGHEAVAISESPDVIVVNSCTVTAESDRKARQNIRKYRRANPQAVIVLTGCLPQAFPEDAKNLDSADILLGNGTNSKLLENVDKFLATGERIIDIVKHARGGKFDTPTIDRFPERTRAYLKIQDGCERYCTYCIIPYARGHIRSKPLSEIAKEVKNFVATDYKEIVVVGINLCCYGKDFNDGTRLIDAIELICHTAENCRIRLGSIEPEMISDNDIKRMAGLKNLCPQFHLSLQSGCNNTLRAMNRKYTSDEYAELCEKLRAKFPDCAITTDIMVGFPGETDEDFKQSLAFAEKISFAKAHIFPYSRRKGTIADKKPDQISKSIKEQRADKMAKVCEIEQKKFLLSMVGKTCTVLFEKENSPAYHQGYTANYTLVKTPRVDADISLKKQMFDVKITGIENDYCIGEIVKEDTYEK